MRHLAAVVLASLAAVACGNSSPDQTEPSASTSQGVISTTGSGSCYSGYTYQCQQMNGHELCGCVALSCQFDLPPVNPNYNTWVESWAVPSSDGSCPDVPAPTGTWKNLSVVPACGLHGFEGVPCEIVSPTTALYPTPQTCEAFLGTPSCCTYVWWPNGIVPPACGPNVCPTGTAPQFPQVLCAHAGMTIKAIPQGTCNGYPIRCEQPGGGSCETCEGI